MLFRSADKKMVGPAAKRDAVAHLRNVLRMFTPSLRAIPSAPYIAALAERRLPFGPAMKPAGRQLRVGVIWSGSKTSRANADRALPY